VKTKNQMSLLVSNMTAQKKRKGGREKRGEITSTRVDGIMRKAKGGGGGVKSGSHTVNHGANRQRTGGNNISALRVTELGTTLPGLGKKKEEKW